MPSFGTLLGETGSAGKQLFLWGFLAGAVSRATDPFLRKLEYLVNEASPNAILTPDLLADAVVREVLTPTAATPEAASSGITPNRFKVLLDLAGEPPGLETILQLYRRGDIAWGEAGPTLATVANAIATSRIYPYWATAIKALNVVPIPAAEMVDARVENQTTLGTRDLVTAEVAGGVSQGGRSASTSFYDVMWANGYTPDQADLMFRTRGNPPSPGELFTLYRRGKIPLTGTGPDALTVEQGIYEGATKDKWWPTLQGLIPEIPSLYYIYSLVKTGKLPATLGRKLLNESGYTETVINALVGVSADSAVSTYKKLTESVIVNMFTYGAINATETATLLSKIGYGKTAAQFIISYVQLKKAEKYITSAITKVGSNYTSHKLTQTQAETILARLGVPRTQVQTVIATWTTEAAAVVKVPTEAQYIDAFKYNVIGATAMLAGLQSLGYTPYDAWLVASASLHEALPNPPQPGPTVYFTASVP